MSTQNDLILALLKQKPLTALTALREVGCLRLAARVYDLRQKGHKIATAHKTLPNGKVIATYTLEA